MKSRVSDIISAKLKEKGEGPTWLAEQLNKFQDPENKNVYTRQQIHYKTNNNSFTNEEFLLITHILDIDLFEIQHKFIPKRNWESESVVLLGKDLFTKLSKELPAEKKISFKGIMKIDDTEINVELSFFENVKRIKLNVNDLIGCVCKKIIITTEEEKYKEVDLYYWNMLKVEIFDNGDVLRISCN